MNEVITKRKKKLTVRDYELMPQGREILQLIDGDFYMTPAPIFKHQEVSKNIESEFIRFLDKNPVGKIIHSPLDFYVDRFNVVQPDLVYISKENYRIISERGIEGPPDIIIEILSPSTEEIDLNLKMDLYWRIGVREYWIVNIEKEEIQVYEIKEDSFKLRKNYRKINNEKIKTPIVPGLEIDLNKVFYYDWL